MELETAFNSENSWDSHGIHAQNYTSMNTMSLCVKGPLDFVGFRKQLVHHLQLEKLQHHQIYQDGHHLQGGAPPHLQMAYHPINHS